MVPPRNQFLQDQGFSTNKEMMITMSSESAILEQRLVWKHTLMEMRSYYEACFDHVDDMSI